MIFESEYSTIGEFGEVIMGMSPKGDTYNENEKGLPLLNGPTEFGSSHPAPTLYTTDSKRESMIGDLIFCVRGSTTGRMNWSNQIYSLGRGVCAIRGKTKTDTKYIKYVLDVKLNSLLNIAGGGTFPNLKKDDIGDFKIPLLKGRDKLVSIISAYDDLIENNLKRLNLLEKAAQNIYKEWFVNMRFPGHENTPIDQETGLPEGWEEVKIGDLLTHEIGGGWGKEKIEKNFDNPAFVIRGTDFPHIETGNLKDIPFRFHKKSNLKTRNLNAGDIIFEVSGGSTNTGVARSLLITEKLITNLGNDAMCASFCKLMRPKNTSHSYLLFLTLKYLKTTKITEVYEKRSASNIVNYNWNAFLSDVGVSIPSEMLLTKFCTIAQVNIEMQDVLRSQIGHLKSARDILLPRLMNQTIEV